MQQALLRSRLARLATGPPAIRLCCAAGQARNQPQVARLSRQTTSRQTLPTSQLGLTGPDEAELLTTAGNAGCAEPGTLARQQLTSAHTPRLTAQAQIHGTGEGSSSDDTSGSHGSEATSSYSPPVQSLQTYDFDLVEVADYSKQGFVDIVQVWLE
jgi:hypothetical protein